MLLFSFLPVIERDGRGNPWYREGKNELRVIPALSGRWDAYSALYGICVLQFAVSASYDVFRKLVRGE